MPVLRELFDFSFQRAAESDMHLHEHLISQPVPDGLQPAELPPIKGWAVVDLAEDSVVDTVMSSDSELAYSLACVLGTRARKKLARVIAIYPIHGTAEWDYPAYAPLVPLVPESTIRDTANWRGIPKPSAAAGESLAPG